VPRVNQYIDHGIVALDFVVRHSSQNLHEISRIQFPHRFADRGHFFAVADDQQFAGGFAAAKLRDGPNQPATPSQR